jgi:hypothetical protein
MNELQAAGRKALDGPDGLYFRKSSRQGYEKIMYTCRQARKDGLGWAWVDICCNYLVMSTLVTILYKSWGPFAQLWLCNPAVGLADPERVLEQPEGSPESPVKGP